MENITITVTMTSDFSVESTTINKQNKVLKTANKKEYFHQWYAENKSKVLERMNQYNREKSEYIICECGKPIQLKNTRHVNTDLHKRWLERKMTTIKKENDCL